MGDATREKDLCALCEVYRIPAAGCQNADCVEEWLKEGFRLHTLDPAHLLQMASRYGISQNRKNLQTVVSELFDSLFADVEDDKEEDDDERQAQRPWQHYPPVSHDLIHAFEAEMALDWVKEALRAFCQHSEIHLEDPEFMRQTHQKLEKRFLDYNDKYQPPLEHSKVLALAALYVTGYAQGLDEYCYKWPTSLNAWVSWCISTCPKAIFLAYVRDLIGTTL